MNSRLLLGFALLATTLLYWVGLHGPFLLDDQANLEPIQAWLSGENTWQHAVFGNHSGMFGRSLSMASLALSAELGGYTPFAFKLGNLVVHLLCGLLGWQVLRRALARDPHLSGSADLIAALLAALWLLHPLNVSTVLYPVQRMAQMSTLLVLAALWAYLAARQHWLAGRRRQALVGLFVLFPLLLVAGLLGKENAAVAPALCLVLELAYFSARPHRGGLPAESMRPESTLGGRTLQAFFGLSVALPALALGAVLLLHPARLLGGYITRDFGLVQRMLTEPRVLMDYIGLLLLPRNPRLGLFTDDFTASTGLLSPPSTLLSILALLAISALAIAMRKRAPSVFAGWFFFLVAHAVESTILPLELYFEHRNYLPAFGLLLFMVGLCELLTRNIQTNVLSRRQLGLLVASGFILVFAFGTHGRARVWQSEQAIYSQGLDTHPDSARALMANIALGLNTGDMNLAYAAAGRLIASKNPRHEMIGHVSRVMLSCIDHSGANPSDLRQAVLLAQPKLLLYEVYAFEKLEGLGPDVDCGVVNPDMIASAASQIVDAAKDQPDSVVTKWHLRLTAARLHARAGDWKNALVQAKLAWQPGASPAVGGFLARALAHNGKLGEAERAYAETKARTDPKNTADMAGLSELRRFLDQAAARNPTPRAGQPDSPPPLD